MRQWSRSVASRTDHRDVPFLFDIRVLLSWWARPSGDGGLVAGVCVPFGIDALVIVLAARHGDIFWIFPPIVTAVSLVGAALTYWVGRTAGHAGLPRLVPAHQLDRIKACLERMGGGATATAALLPPPFPLTPFLLTCGAFDVNRWRFFLVFGVMRLLRFSAAALLARHYGEYLLQVLESDGLQRAVVTAALVAGMMGITSGVILWRRMRPQPA